MSRTYIGPFGRVLPVPDGREPERQQVLDTGTRTNIATYQLPLPDRLQFGSDSSPGFTEPMRYNTISQSSRSRPPSNPTYGEQAQQAQHLRHEQLPSVRQLLAPSTQPSVPQSPFSPQLSLNRFQRPLKLTSDIRGPVIDQPVRGPGFFNQSAQSQPHLMPTQMPHPTESYQISTPAQQFQPSHIHHQGPSISHYAPPFETSQQMSHTPQHQQALPPTYSQHQQIMQPNPTQLQQATPLDPGNPQQALAVNAPAQYYQDQPSIHETTVNSAMNVEQNPPATANSVKPLPRLVGEQDVPGEGPSWVYEDGTTCKKVIDGEEVNAQWGLTKAGKPRKRLAIACTTCREKKTKCDPAEPKCVQCEKFGRECRFTTAFRAQRSSPDSPSYDSQARTSLINTKSARSPASLESPSRLFSPQVKDKKPLKRCNSSPETRTEKTFLSSNDEFDKATVTKGQRSSSPGSITSGAEPQTRALEMSYSVPQPQRPWEIEPVQVDIHSFGWVTTLLRLRAISQAITLKFISPT